MTLPVEYEILVPLVIAIVFSLLYEMDRREMLWSGIVGMGVWLVASMVYLVVSDYPVIALVFMTVGIVYVIRILIDLFKPLKDTRKMEDEG